MERQVFAAVRELVYAPLSATFAAAGGPGPMLANAAGDADELVLAIRTGAVSYAGDYFSGRFRAQTARALRAIGARLSAARGAYYLPERELPAWVLAAVAANRRQSAELHEALLLRLDQLQEQIEGGLLRARVDATRTVSETSEGFRASVGDALRAQPQLTPDGLYKLARAYELGTQKPIRGLAVEATQRLRRTVRRNAEAGGRFDRLVDGIRREYGAARGRARFIAQQETSMFQAAFREERFSEAGVSSYVWQITRDSRVRDDHRRLNGQVFFYSQPPVVNLQTGKRANPGVDYGCRCLDRPVVP